MSTRLNTLRNQVIYCVYVRNHTPEGTFRALQADLPRIRALGVDILWLMPIHPIGIQGRKGTLGCPYAISDFRAINPEYGTLDDFHALVNAVHAQGMQCMIDVVYNHTSPDSWLALHHPEWFYHSPEGLMGNRCGEWTDVVDLDYANRSLWEYQIQTLEYWATLVDGFRCDVAPAVPIGFWEAARERVEKIRPNCLWLAETSHPSFIRLNRDRGFTVHPDEEMYPTFDITYDYDIHDAFAAYFAGSLPWEGYIAAIQNQERRYPRGYLKLRFLENHDQPRARSFIHTDAEMRNYLTFLYFVKGVTLLYAGQETCDAHAPSLFEKDPVDWHTGPDISGFLHQLSSLRHHPLVRNGTFSLDAHGEAAVLQYRQDREVMLAAIHVGSARQPVPVSLPDGAYANRLDGRPVTIRDGHLLLSGEPVVLQENLEA